MQDKSCLSIALLLQHPALHVVMWQKQSATASHGVAGDATMKSDKVLGILQWHGQIQVTMAGLSCSGVDDTERTAVMPRACFDEVNWQG